jgi:hypothetical protein
MCRLESAATPVCPTPQCAQNLAPVLSGVPQAEQMFLFSGKSNRQPRSSECMKARMKAAQILEAEATNVPAAGFARLPSINAGMPRGAYIWSVRSQEHKMHSN